MKKKYKIKHEIEEHTDYFYLIFMGIIFLFFLALILGFTIIILYTGFYYLKPSIELKYISYTASTIIISLYFFYKTYYEDIKNPIKEKVIKHTIKEI